MTRTAAPAAPVACLLGALLLGAPAGAAPAPAATPPQSSAASSAAGSGALPDLAQATPQPTLPRAALLDAVLAQAPSLAEARAMRDAAAAQGDALRAGPQEFTAQAQVQQRRVDEPPDNGNYAEWQLLLSRGVRLPSQQRADAQLANTLAGGAEVAQAAARRSLLQTLLQAWFDAQQAAADAVLARADARALDAQALALGKRLQLGDASQLEFDQMQAEQARARAALQLAQGRADSLRAALQARWPLLAADPKLQGDAASASQLQPPQLDDAQLRQLLIDHSTQLAQARSALQQAQARADQAGAARTPSPTVGAYLGSDRGGRERILGLQLQVPFGGPARAAGERAALAEVQAAQWRLQDLHAQVLEQSERARVQATSQAQAAQALEQAAEQQRSAAARMQRAWQLGEASLSDWLVARRGALDVQRQALQARFDAARSAAELRLQAGMLDPKPLRTGEPLNPR